MFGGVFSALFGTGGPIYTIYLSRRIAALDAFRATISVVILASGVVRAGAFAAAGLYGQPAMLKSAALLLPVALAGLYAGSRLRTRVAPARLQRLIFLLLAVAGAGRSIAGGCRLRDGAVAASGMRSYPRDGARAAAPPPAHAATSPSAWRTPRPWRCSRASAA